MYCGFKIACLGQDYAAKITRRMSKKILVHNMWFLMKNLLVSAHKLIIKRLARQQEVEKDLFDHSLGLLDGPGDSPPSS